MIICNCFLSRINQGSFPVAFKKFINSQLFNFLKQIKKMKKQLLLLAATLFAGASMLKAQTNVYPLSGSAGLGTVTPATSALLDMSSTTQGLLAPRMTKVQRDAIASPATGLLIFQTNSTPGFYYYNGSSWTAISTKGANTSLSNLAAGGTSINVGLTPATNNCF